MSEFTTRPEIRGTFGAVTSTHWLASAAGMAMLERGGNAFDAAVAAGFTLQVVEPHMNGPGGEVPLIVWSRARREAEVICGQGPAPAEATIERFRELDLELVPGSGLLAAVVPGAFGAWLRLLRDYGRLSLGEVLAPAIGYAERGFPLILPVVHGIERVRGLFEREWRSSAALYLPGGELPTAGALFRNAELAATYTRILREAEAAGHDRERQIEAARRAWYEGWVAERIDAFCRDTEVMDTSGRRHRGLLRADDLVRWSPSVETPLSFDYHGYTVCKTGAWGQGPVFLQQLALLAGFDLADTSPASAELVHTVTECAKLAFADREAFYGDPDFVEVPIAQLLSPEYNAARRALVAADASHELRPGEVPGFGGRPILRAQGSTPAAYAEALEFGEPTALNAAAASRPGRGDTCHLDVVDAEGNFVSATPSGGWLHGSPVIPGLGFPLSTRAQMFWLEPGLPASLAPGKRPRTTLTPSLALRDGEPWLAFGTPGGDQQDQWSLHAFLRHVHFGLDLQAAIDAPEFHTAHMPSSFYPREWDPGHLALEGRFAPEAIAELERRGHRVEIFDDWSLGYVTAAGREQGLLKAGASPRFMQAYAVGR